MIGNASKTLQLADGQMARLVSARVSVDLDGQTEFRLEYPVAEGTQSVLIVNTVSYRDGYYTLIGRALEWISAEFALDPEDELVLHYYTSAS